MTKRKTKIALSFLLSFTLPIAASTMLARLQAPNEPVNASAPTQAAPMSQSELRALVAPIALYPDNLVAEILAASTFPDQVAVANYWLQQNKNLTGNALTQAVDRQSWDSSVKGLTQFPSVLNNMAKSLSWTSQLGEAYHNQKPEVMSSIQALREQAKAAGNLKSTPQITVQQQSPQTIVIQPANPDIVYVPEYNPALVYGYPYVTPGYSAAEVAATSALSFGAGVALGAWASGGWGWHNWGCDWSGGSVTFNHNTFYGNSAWHGGYAGGYHPYGADGGYHPYGTNAYNRTDNRNEVNRNVSGNTVNVNKAGVQNFSGNHFSDANSWAQHSNWADKSTAFSGLSGHQGGFEDRSSEFRGAGESGGGFGGWSSRADSARGWGSMNASGFGGFHGGFGGFHGGGGRR